MASRTAQTDPVQRIYRLHPQAAVEHLNDGVLVYQPEANFVLELNPTARLILEQTDGQRDTAQVATWVAVEFGITYSEAAADVAALYEALHAQRVVEKVARQQSEGEDNMPDAMYIRNPDVSLREETEDGAMLFNPDTSRIQIINPTGLFIWKQCNGTHTLEAIAQAMAAEYEGAPLEEIAADVRAFIDHMVQNGFMGTVEPVSSGGKNL